MANPGFTRLDLARLIAILMPTALLGGAIGSQYPGGLVPCEMCYWQRWPHLAAIFLALAAIAMRNRAPPNIVLTVLACLVVVAGGAWGPYDSSIAIWKWVLGVLVVLSALVALSTSGSTSRQLTALAALAIAVSGVIGIFHAGIEYHWWEGLTRCSATPLGGGGLAEIMAAPVTRCDVAQWTLAGISLAGFNAILSLGAALAVFILLRRRAA